MDTEKLKEILIQHEGKSKFVYKDSLGYFTIGIGRCVDKKKGSGLSEEEQEYLLSNDIKQCESQLMPYVWYQQLDDVRKCVMIELCFNLGLNGLLEFRHMLDALKNRNYDLAVIELKNSLWSRQVGQERSKNIYYRLLRGAYPS